MIPKPYKDTSVDGVIIRKFVGDEEGEYVWHRDLKTRCVTVVAGSAWYIQFDNELPQELKCGESVWIPQMVYHRVIKGEDNLIVKIRELE